MSLPRHKKVLAICGGVGGAKLALGLSRLLAPEQLSIVTNTADDFEHLGLHISPDLDTVMYTLAGLNNKAQGWGRADETWSFMEALGQLGGQTWFRVGDKDIATHVQRTRLLAEGKSLSQATRILCEHLGVKHAIVPMSDDPVRTLVKTTQGELAFQHYFVRERCTPKVTGFRFQGMEDALPSEGFASLLADPELAVMAICPSNPFVSIDPIMNLPGVRQALRDSSAVIVAVSPIVGGRALKGPAAKMMQELNMTPTALSVARHYGDLLQGFVVDNADSALDGDVTALGLQCLVTATVMRSLQDRIDLATAVVSFALSLQRKK